METPRIPKIPEPFSRFMIGFHMILFFFSLYQIKNDTAFYTNLAQIAISGIIIWSIVYLLRGHLIFELNMYEYEHNHPPNAKHLRDRLNKLYVVYAAAVFVYIVFVWIMLRF